MIYEIRDSLLGTGSIRAELLTAAEGSGIILKVEGSNLPSGTRLAWAFGGVSGKKGPPQRRHRLRGPARLPVLPGHRGRVRRQSSQPWSADSYHSE